MNRGAPLDWDDVRVFLAVARAGSLGGAARALSQTQPTMGRRIRALERDLGRTLFQRTAHGFVLTADGEAVLRHAERIEGEMLAVARSLQGHEAALEGRLRLSAPDWLARRVLAPGVAAFVRAHPGVEVELLSDARSVDLARRDADLAFRIHPFDAPDVVSRRFSTTRYAVYAPRDAAAPAPMDDGVRLLTLSEGLASLPDAAWLADTFPRATVAARSNSREVLAALCAGGAGLAVLPRALGDALDALRAIDLPAPPSRTVWVGYHRDLRGLPRLHALLEALDGQARALVPLDAAG